jgi:hypothetical protein
MNAEKLIALESTVAVTGIVAGDLIGQGDQRTLPKPRQILAAYLLFGILAVVAQLGQGPARVAALLGGLITLTALVAGALGKNLVNLINRGAGLFSPGTLSASVPGVATPSTPIPGTTRVRGPGAARQKAGPYVIPPGNPNTIGGGFAN